MTGGSGGKFNQVRLIFPQSDGGNRFQARGHSAKKERLNQRFEEMMKKSDSKV